MEPSAAFAVAASDGRTFRIAHQILTILPRNGYIEKYRLRNAVSCNVGIDEIESVLKNLSGLGLITIDSPGQNDKHALPGFERVHAKPNALEKLGELVHKYKSKMEAA